jgi:UDP-2,3-diacylglucosamine pyrophosphatase LpxH
MKRPKLRYRTVVISDVHLGATGSKAKEVNFFLKHTRCDKLIMNGDIIDTWALKRNGVWTKDCTNFIRHVLKKIEKHNTQVIYTRGNHDDLLERFLPMQFAGIRVVENHIHRTSRGDYLVLHGDVFDSVNNNLKFLAKIGAVGYAILLRINRLYNIYRKWRGKEYFSMSAAIKSRVKKAVNKVSSYEPSLAAMAKSRNCQGIITGHIHTVADKMIDGIHYLNSGDWMESLTALVEEKDGRIHVLTYPEFHKLLAEKTERVREKKMSKSFMVKKADGSTIGFSPEGAPALKSEPSALPPDEPATQAI